MSKSFPPTWNQRPIKTKLCYQVEYLTIKLHKEGERRKQLADLCQKERSIVFEQYTLNIQLDGWLNRCGRMSGWGLSSVKLTWAYNELQQKYDVSDGYNDIQERYDTDIEAETQMNATLQQQLQVHIDRQAKQVSGHKKGASEQGRSLRGNTWKSNRTDLKKKKHRAAWEAQHWGKTPACPPHRKSEHWRTRCASRRRCPLLFHWTQNILLFTAVVLKAFHANDPKLRLIRSGTFIPGWCLYVPPCSPMGFLRVLRFHPTVKRQYIYKKENQLKPFKIKLLPQYFVSYLVRGHMPRRKEWEEEENMNARKLAYHLLQSSYSTTNYNKMTGTITPNVLSERDQFINWLITCFK